MRTQYGVELLIPFIFSSLQQMNLVEQCLSTPAGLKSTGSRGMAQASHLQVIDDKDLRDVVLVRTSVGACLRGHFVRTGRKVAVKLIKDR